MASFQPTPHLDLVRHACWTLREEPTSATLDQLSAQLHLSSRHLRRIMLHHVGVGPAHYLRLSRFVKSLHMMPKSASLTDIAYGVHYADQAHFSRDFREIAGMTPKEYRRRMSNEPGHIFACESSASVIT
jgi:methylphosphotriester-DNA--protein-cysteine methyltransferase